jgi:DMSO reductase anchor subunit
MNPAWSVVVFTTAAGAGQGLVVALAAATLARTPLNGAAFRTDALGIALSLLVLGLASSFLHLGRPMRAWRAIMMWRTSWLSREVIVLPSFIALVALWWWLLHAEAPGRATTVLLPLACVVLSAVLWHCTSMIYACLRFIAEWAHPLTGVGFTLIGVASGLVLCSALAALAGEVSLLRAAGPAAIAATAAALATRAFALHRNAHLVLRSTLQSATGIAAPRLTQLSMGMSAGSFNTREFFHGASARTLVAVRAAAIGLGFIVPFVLMLWALTTGAAWPWLAAPLVQVPGLIADRWLFFAQARHPQNLYYQTVS